MEVDTWHAAKLRLTGILFPMGFVALVRTGSPDRPVPFDRRSPSPRPLARHLGIHGHKAGAGKSLEKSEKRAVHAARNGPSADRQYWQRFELGIQGLKNWGRNWSRKVRETRSSSSRKRPEPAAHPCRGPGGQAGDEHGGSPWFKGTRGRGRTLCGTNIRFYKIRSHQYWTGVRFRLVEVSEVSAAINGRAGLATFLS